MKKIETGEQWQRRGRARYEARLAEKRRKSRRRASKTLQPKHERALRKNDTSEVKWVDLYSPAKLNLDSDKKSTCSFLEEAENRIKSGQKVRLAFQDTESISPEALIYLLAKIQRLRIEHGIPCVTGTYPQQPRIERLLADSGFLKLLGVKTRTIKGRTSSTRYVKCKTDVKLNGPYIKDLREELLGANLSMPTLIAKKVFRAITEAMANVNHHAYQRKDMRSTKMKGRWWLAGQLNARKNTLCITFYDAGVGIPKTLPRIHGLERIRQALSVIPGVQVDDGQMIRAAVELGRSATKQGHRGKGLQDMHKLLTQVGAGSLTIYSRQGIYHYEDGNEKISNGNGFVEGTLIKWQLPLDRSVSGIDFDELEQDYENA